jgi:hypothetical protein
MGKCAPKQPLWRESDEMFSARYLRNVPRHHDMIKSIRSSVFASVGILVDGFLDNPSAV